MYIKKTPVVVLKKPLIEGILLFYIFFQQFIQFQPYRGYRKDI